MRDRQQAIQTVAQALHAAIQKTSGSYNRAPTREEYAAIMIEAYEALPDPDAVDAEELKRQSGEAVARAHLQRSEEAQACARAVRERDERIADLEERLHALRRKATEARPSNLRSSILAATDDVDAYS